MSLKNKGKMKAIIDVNTKEEIRLKREDLPIMIHGKEHSGASLFSITVAAGLHEAGEKLYIFTAYPMAKEEFMKQIANLETVFYLENEVDIEKALSCQTVIVQSGNIDLFLKVLPLVKGERVIFIKNMETVQIPIYDFITDSKFIVSGDMEVNALQKDFLSFKYNTKVFLTPVGGKNFPHLAKYQVFLKNDTEERILTIQQ